MALRTWLVLGAFAVSLASSVYILLNEEITKSESELRVLKIVGKNKREASLVNAEMKRARELYLHKDLASQQTQTDDKEMGTRIVQLQKALADMHTRHSEDRQLVRERLAPALVLRERRLQPAHRGTDHPASDEPTDPAADRAAHRDAADEVEKERPDSLLTTRQLTAREGSRKRSMLSGRRAFWRRSSLTARSACASARHLRTSSTCPRCPAKVCAPVGT